MQKARSSSATMSMAPVMAITAPARLEKSLAKATAPSRFSSVTLSATSASTPLVVPLPRARVLISEMLPRITVNFTSLSRPKAVSVRRVEAPAPTGSNTTGWPSSLARFPAANMAGMVRWFSVPMLMFSPPQMAVISSASPASSAIMGEPPQASSMFAQSLTVT